MSDHNNRLFHYMEFKDLVWIHERDLKSYADPTNVLYKPGEEFLIQHIDHGTWSMGVYRATRRKEVHKIKWLRVIVIRGQ